MALFIVCVIMLALALQDTVQAACPVSNSVGCFCQNEVIDCGSKRLTVVPSFLQPGPETFTLLKLSNNSITRLQNNAFLNINVSRIELDNNQIATIDDQAFNGLEHIQSLSLKGNKLDAVPEAFKSLTHLTTLNVLHNPIRNVPDDVFYTLGANLRELSFGDDELTEWPTTLNHLQTLKTLHFEGMDMTDIPFNAFHGFELTLNKLVIRRTSLNQVPLAVKELENLNEFYFEDNILVGDPGIIESAFNLRNHGSNITTLSLKNNSLTTFPTVLRVLYNLKNFSMDNNNLWYVSDEMVNNIASFMKIVSLRNCQLDRIPQALLRINPLTKLDLSYNNINSIYNNDLEPISGDHRNLQTIDLSHNPLAYVADSAFSNLVNLNTLNLDRTDLKVIPTAFLDSKTSLREVTMVDTPVECTCDLKWVLKVPRINITGECDTVAQSISNYIKYRIPKCP